MLFQALLGEYSTVKGQRQAGAGERGGEPAATLPTSAAVAAGLAGKPVETSRGSRAASSVRHAMASRV